MFILLKVLRVNQYHQRSMFEALNLLCIVIIIRDNRGNSESKWSFPSNAAKFN